jgi:hypothetical protein
VDLDFVGRPLGRAQFRQLLLAFLYFPPFPKLSPLHAACRGC